MKKALEIGEMQVHCESGSSEGVFSSEKLENRASSFMMRTYSSCMMPRVESVLIPCGKLRLKPIRQNVCTNGSEWAFPESNLFSLSELIL